MMGKYLQVTWVMVKNSLIRDSKISGYIITKIAVQLVEIITMVVYFKIIFANIQTLAGWNYYQVLFLYSYSRSIMLLDNAFFKKGVASFTKTMIRKGEYDFFLVKPINPMYLVSISNPQIYYILSAGFYLLLAIYSLFQSGIEIQLVNILWFILLSVFGFTLYYLLNILTIIPTFWFVRLYNLKDIIYKVNHFMRYPIGLFPQFLQIALLIFFPIVVVSYIPATTLFYPPKLGYIGYMILVTIVFGFLTTKLWKLGQRHYSSASS